MNFIITHKYALLTLLGAIIVALGAFKSSLDRKKTEDEFKEANDTIKAQNEEIKRLSSLTIQLQNHSIEELNHQRNSITGGNTFPVVFIFAKDNKTPHIFSPGLIASGKYPLYNFDIKFSIKNGPETKDPFIVHMAELRQISPTYFKELTFDLKKYPDLEIGIRTSARNGVWEQKFKFRKTKDSKYQYETAVTPFYDDNPLLEKKFEDDGMPMGNMSDIESLRFDRQ